MLQLRRVGLGVGESTEAPDVPYRANLELAENGFVALYPGLWLMESQLS